MHLSRVSRGAETDNARYARRRSRNPITLDLRISGMWTEVLNHGENAFDLERYLQVAGATRPEAFDWSEPETAARR